MTELITNHRAIMVSTLFAAAFSLLLFNQVLIAPCVAQQDTEITSQATSIIRNWLMTTVGRQLLQRLNVFGALLQTFQHNLNLFINSVIVTSNAQVNQVANLVSQQRGQGENNSTTTEAPQSQSNQTQSQNQVSNVGHNTIGAGEGDVPHVPTSGRPGGVEPPRVESTANPNGVTKAPTQVGNAGSSGSNAGNSGSAGNVLGGAGRRRFG